MGKALARKGIELSSYYYPGEGFDSMSLGKFPPLAVNGASDFSVTFRSISYKGHSDYSV